MGEKSQVKLTAAALILACVTSLANMVVTFNSGSAAKLAGDALQDERITQLIDLSKNHGKTLNEMSDRMLRLEIAVINEPHAK